MSQLLACVPSQDLTLENPPCPVGSALVVVDSDMMVSDPWVGATEAAVAAFVIIVSAFFVGLIPSLIRRI